MPIQNIAGYQFIPLNNLASMQSTLKSLCEQQGLLGTILLSPEGVNMSLAGQPEAIAAFRASLPSLFAEMSFHETYSSMLPFQTLKIKIKKEIITFQQPGSTPTADHRAPAISPETLKAWLDEGRDITLLDTRNDYEYRFGTFKGAVNLKLHHFTELADAISPIHPDKPVVMFCTGGIRCEKAGILMQQKGFEVYQLDGGILGYFAKVGGAHYEGECFVFDERVALDPQLKDTDTIQCLSCQGPVTLAEQHLPAYVRGVSCPACG